MRFVNPLIVPFSRIQKQIYYKRGGKYFFKRKSFKSQERNESLEMVDKSWKLMALIFSGSVGPVAPLWVELEVGFQFPSLLCLETGGPRWCRKKTSLQKLGVQPCIHSWKPIGQKENPSICNAMLLQMKIFTTLRLQYSSHLMLFLQHLLSKSSRCQWVSLRSFVCAAASSCSWEVYCLLSSCTPLMFSTLSAIALMSSYIVDISALQISFTSAIRTPL